ncbi:MAG TPA: cation ABC transporter substrate-binding protein [Prolixibacteraceae bacterium]|jgi:zinc transport system substrate-binding protein|nr:cation ABC transporter substrate-binding protein [Prolixibacteraceae bacterium]
MKNYFYLIILLLAACQPKPKDERQLVSVSILPQKYFVDQIAGNLLQVNVLVPPGSSPHNYEILPSQMKDLAKSKAWLQIGLLTFEAALKDKLADLNKDLSIVNCSEGIIPIAGIEHEEEGHAEQADHGAFDPHTWLAPAEAKIIAQNTLKALKTAFPDHAKDFETNYTRFISRIDSLSAQITQKLAPLKNRNILIFHPALAYYARQFGMQQIALELNGKDPSPRHMKEIVDLAHSQNIRVIFIQKEFDASFALQLSREINGEVVIIDPLDYNWEKQMLDITDKIAAQK